MFIAALFTIANLWNQPKCSPSTKWMKITCYILTIGYYFVLEKEEAPVICNNMGEPEGHYPT